MDNLLERVRASLEAAKENGYDMDHLTSIDIAIDLAKYDSDLENERIGVLALAVNEIRYNDK